MQQPCILLIDDDPDVLEFLSYNLIKSGYQVFTALNGKQGIKKANKLSIDLVILDIMMPENDGIEICEQMRQNPKTEDAIIVFLTARNEDFSQIAGFDAGADDYIAKPVNPKILVRRVKALLKRKQHEREQPVEKNQYNIRSINIDPEKYEVEHGGKKYVLPRKEFELLSLLLSVPERVFTRDEIYDKIWGETFVGERTIDVHIRRLREKFGAQHIITVKGIGYKFVDGNNIHNQKHDV
ncbi:MAG: response regulator transcription factor [Bacteroidota bacterium]